MFKNIAVYTCISGKYDNLLPIYETSDKIDFICFADSYKKDISPWKLSPLQSPQILTNGHYINRFHKIFSKKILSNYRYSIYIDGNIEYKNNFYSLAEAFIDTKCAIGAFKHPDMRNLYEEKDACIKFKKFNKYDLQRYDDQLTDYKRSGYDLSKSISANYLIIKDHSFLIDQAMSLWWSHLFEYTRRDQMSFNYLMWKENIPFVFLDEISSISHENIYRHYHNINFIKKNILKLIKTIKNKK